MHAERLRCAYLSWIHDLGETRIDGRRVIDHLSLGDGLSYWWMTLLVEQSPWKSPQMVDAIRILALEEILLAEGPEAVRLVSGNRRLHEVLVDLCHRLNVAYTWDRVPSAGARPSTIERIYRALPYSLQAFISVARHVRLRWPLRRLPMPSWSSGPDARLFCSYFIHLDSAAAERGAFHSRQW